MADLPRSRFRRVPMVVVEDLGMRLRGHPDPEGGWISVDRRRLANEFRRVRRAQQRRGVRGSAFWWVLFWRQARKYGVRA